MKKVILGVVTLSAIAAMIIMNTKKTTEENNTSTQMSSIEHETMTKSNSTSKIDKEVEEKKNFNAFKEVFPELLTETKNLPICFAQANTKEEAEECGTKLFIIQRELSTIVGDVSEESNTSLIPEWNQEIKKEMIESVEKSIPIIYKQNKCVQNAQNTGDIEACFKEE